MINTCHARLIYFVIFEKKISLFCLFSNQIPEWSVSPRAFTTPFRAFSSLAISLSLACLCACFILARHALKRAAKLIWRFMTSWSNLWSTPIGALMVCSLITASFNQTKKNRTLRVNLNLRTLQNSFEEFLLCQILKDTKNILKF